MLTDAEWNKMTVAEKRDWLRRHVQRAEETISTWQPSVDNLCQALETLCGAVENLSDTVADTEARLRKAEDMLGIARA